MTEREEVFLKLIQLRMRHGIDSSVGALVRLLDATGPDNHHLLKSASGIPEGYVCWANVSRETVWALQDTRILPRYDYEWNEGRIVLLMDLVFEHDSRFALRRVLYKMFSDRRLIIFVHKDRVSLYRRRGSKFQLARRCA